MQGFITDTELDQADQVFPGIAAFFDGLAEKPRTFLELLCAFDHWCEKRPDHLACDNVSVAPMSDAVLQRPSAKLCPAVG